LIILFLAILDFELGDLSPAASREELQYKGKTPKIISDKFYKIKDKITSRIKKDIDKCDSYISACLKWTNYDLENVVKKSCGSVEYEIQVKLYKNRDQ